MLSRETGGVLPADDEEEVVVPAMLGMPAAVILEEAMKQNKLASETPMF